jgi:galactokinase/mevalonate kinase-like predicted kinase
MELPPGQPEARTRPRKLVCSAPGRAGIIGNPTDMYGGSVLSCSVAMRARATLTPLEPDGPTTQSSLPAAAQGAEGRWPVVLLETNGQRCPIYGREDLRPRGDSFDLARAVLDYLRVPALGCHVVYESDIPLRSGLAGSTALVVALLESFLVWQGEQNHPYQLAERARYVELNYLEVVCGYQDACMATFGGLNYMDFRGKQFYRRAEAELYATIEPLASYVPDLPFILGYTGVQHASSAVHKPLRERWLEGDPEVIQGYERITELARMGKKALLMADWRTLGRLMNENHAIQRDLGGSGESNERLIGAAVSAGALGAKLAGAGDGGTIIALWPWTDSAPLEQALCAAGACAIYRPQAVPGVQIEQLEQMPIGVKE